MPENEAQVRPLTELSEAEAVHVWGQVTEQHDSHAPPAVAYRRYHRW